MNIPSLGQTVTGIISGQLRAETSLRCHPSCLSLRLVITGDTGATLHITDPFSFQQSGC